MWYQKKIVHNHITGYSRSWVEGPVLGYREANRVLPYDSWIDLHEVYCCGGKIFQKKIFDPLRNGQFLTRSTGRTSLARNPNETNLSSAGKTL